MRQIVLLTSGEFFVYYTQYLAVKVFGKLELSILKAV